MRLPKHFPGVRINEKYGAPFSGMVGSIEGGELYIGVRLIKSIPCKCNKCDIPEWNINDLVWCDKKELTPLNDFAKQLLDTMKD